MYSYEPLHMAEQKQGDQLEPTYSSSVRIRGIAPRTCWMRLTIGRCGKRGLGISVLMARQDDLYIYICGDETKLKYAFLNCSWEVK